MFIKSALYLTKKPITGKQKQLSSKANVFFSFVDIIMLMLLAKFEFDTWFHFLNKKKKQRIIQKKKQQQTNKQTKRQGIIKKKKKKDFPQNLMTSS